MTRPRPPIRVAGEPVAALLPALVAMHRSMVVDDDGMAADAVLLLVQRVTTSLRRLQDVRRAAS